MRILAYIVLILINFILQATVITDIAIIGIHPNLVLILVVSFAFMRGDIEGALIGFLAGLLIDSFFGHMLGLNAFIYFFVGFLAGKLYNHFNKDTSITPFLLTMLFSVMFDFFNFIVYAFLDGYPNIFPFLKDIIVPSALYTGIVSFFIYRIYYIINEKLEKYDRKKKNLFK